MKRFLLPEEGNFYKANLHCHSTVSDGFCTPKQIKENYMAMGYSIVAYTDHDVMIPHPELTDETFVALNGYEMSIDERIPGLPGNCCKCCHMCLIALEPEGTKQVCWHRSKYVEDCVLPYVPSVRFDEREPDYEREYTGACISDMMRRGREGGFFVTYNHPAWSMEDARDYSGYHGMHAMEICNFAGDMGGYGDYNPLAYDEILRGGERIYCIAADDNHGPWNQGGGFTMIKSPRLEYRAITGALEQGHFYASQGPLIYALWLEDGKVHIRCSPAVSIEMKCRRRRTDFCRAPEGETVTEAVFPVYPEDGYFRLTVIDEHGKHANTNAYFTDECL